MFAAAMAAMLLVASAAVVMPLLLSDEVTVAFTDKSNYETLIIAHETGMLEEAGVRPLLVTGGIQAAEALVTGSADMAAMGDGPAVRLLEADSGAMVVARFIGGEGMHRFIAHADISEPKDLEEERDGEKTRVGLQQASSTHGAFLRWAEGNNLDTDRFEIVPMNPMDIPAAMASGDIQAMAGSEPWAIATERVMGPSAWELGNSSGQGTHFPIVLVASERIIAQNPEAVRSMVEVLDRGNRFIMQNWSEAMGIIAARTGVASVEEQDFCGSLQFYEVGFNRTDMESLEMAAQVMLDFKRIKETPDIAARADLRFLPED